MIRAFRRVVLIFSPAVSVALICITVGCDGTNRPSTVKVSGGVKVNGKPMTKGRIRFIPEESSEGKTAIGDIDETGHFRLSTFEPGDGIVPGMYVADVSGLGISDPPQTDAGADMGAKVANEEAAGGSPSVPKKYTDTKTSGLRYTITESDDGRELNINLQ